MLAAFEHNGIDSVAISAYRAAVSKYFARPYVTGVDVGLKLTDGVHDASQGIVLRIHVAEKRSRRTLRGDEYIPRQFKGVRTDVVQARYRRGGAQCDSLEARASRASILAPGVRIGVANNGYGTLGMFVSRRKDPANTYFVTAAHVVRFGASSNASSQIFQPSAEVTGAAMVASTADLHLGLDAALCAVGPGLATTARAIDVDINFAGTALPSIGETLQKSGASSCLTQGIVDGLGEYRDQAYVDELEGVGPAFRVIPEAPATADLSVSLPGDSGSVWFDPVSGNLIGLDVRGPDHSGGGDQYAIASLMTAIESAFGLDIH
jgi:hypothetical protein